MLLLTFSHHVMKWYAYKIRRRKNVLHVSFSTSNQLVGRISKKNVNICPFYRIWQRIWEKDLFVLAELANSIKGREALNHIFFFYINLGFKVKMKKRKKFLRQNVLTLYKIVFLEPLSLLSEHQSASLLQRSHGKYNIKLYKYVRCCNFFWEKI